MDNIILKVDSEGRIKLPKKFIDELLIHDEVTCSLVNKEIIIKPSYEKRRKKTKSLLEKLKSEGYKGEELLLKLKEAKENLESKNK